MARLHFGYKNSKPLILVVVLMELAICYGFISLSIDRGNLWWYFLAIIFFVRSIKDLVLLTRKIFNGHKSANA